VNLFLDRRLASRASSGRFPRFELCSLDKLSKQFGWRHIERTGQGDELDDVDAPFPIFVFGDERLRAIEPIGELLLGEARSLARSAKEFEKLQLFG
jgi:hypothetical protein